MKLAFLLKASALAPPLSVMTKKKKKAWMGTGSLSLEAIETRLCSKSRYLPQQNAEAYRRRQPGAQSCPRGPRGNGAVPHRAPTGPGAGRRGHSSPTNRPRRGGGPRRSALPAARRQPRLPLTAAEPGRSRSRPPSPRPVTRPQPRHRHLRARRGRALAEQEAVPTQLPLPGASGPRLGG